MSVRKRGKTWTAFLTYKENNNNKRTTKGGFRTKKEAEIFETNFKAAHNNNELNGYRTSLFIDYFDNWMEKYETSGVARQTLISHHTAQKIVHERLSSYTVEEMTKNIFQRFLNDYAKDHAKSTVRALSVNVGMVLKDAVSEGLIPIDPTFRIKINGYASKDKEEKFLEEKDFNNMISHIEKYPLNKWLMAIYTTALSGMRISETLALTMDDFDFNKKIISVTKSKSAHRPFEYSDPKTKSSIRKIEMSDKFFQQLDRYIKECSPLDEHIFGESSDARINGKKLRSLLEAIGSDKIISPHGLRHTHASILLSKNVDINYISARLGHSNVTITQNVYGHLLENHRISEAEKARDIF